MEITTKVNGDTLSATEFDQILTELQNNLINKSGQTAAPGTLTQVGVAVSSIAGQGGVFCVDSGVTDAYVLTQVSPFPAPFALTNGLTIRFRPGNTNTTTATANAFALGTKTIKMGDGTTDIVAGMLSTAADAVIRFNFALDVWILGGTASQYNVGTTSGTIPLNGTASATTAVAGVSELATNAETATAVDTSRPIVPSALASLFGASVLASTIGTFYIPLLVSGAFVKGIINIGRVNTSSGTPVNLQTAFPTAAIIGLINHNGINTVINANANTISLTQITPYFSGGGSIDLFYVAVGY